MSHALDIGNRIAWEIFLDISSQVIFEPTSGRIVGLLHDAAWRLIDEHDPKDALKTFRLVRAAEREFVKVQGEKYDRQQKRNKLKRDRDNKRGGSRTRLPVSKARRHR